MRLVDRGAQFQALLHELFSAIAASVVVAGKDEASLDSPQVPHLQKLLTRGAQLLGLQSGGRMAVDILVLVSQRCDPTPEALLWS